MTEELRYGFLRDTVFSPESCKVAAPGWSRQPSFFTSGYTISKDALAPTDGEVPGQAAEGGFVEHALVLAELVQDGQGFRAQRDGIGDKVSKQGADGQEAIGSGKPLGLRQMARPVRVAGSLFEEQGHGVFVGGEEVEERADPKVIGQFLEGVLVARQSLTVDKDVKARVLALDNDVKTCSHCTLSVIEARRQGGETLHAVT